MLIYKATNIINKKVYIGQTTKPLQRRISSHKSAYKRFNFRFYQAIKKYGFENFLFEQIDEASSLSELNEKEIYWIKYYNSYDYNNGYNSTLGGNFSYEPSIETRKKISNSLKNGYQSGKIKPTIYHPTEDEKQKLRDKFKMPFDEVLSAFKKKNYTLLLDEKDYKGIKHKANYICDKGHKRNTFIYQIVLREAKCQLCFTYQNRLKYEDVKNLFEKENYKLLISKKNFDNSNKPFKKVKVLCNNNHTSFIEINNFKNGHKCKTCSLNNKKGKAIHSEKSKQKIRASMIGKLNHGWIDIPSEDMNIILKARKEGLSIYKICKYKLNNKYSRSVVSKRISQME